MPRWLQPAHHRSDIKIMFALNRKTQKRYYDDPSLGECIAHVVKVDGNRVELDATVAYPKGGGQDADQGMIVLPDGRQIRFIHVRKMYGNRAMIPDFPDILVDGIIEHVVHEDDVALLALLTEGRQVVVCIDRLRRARLSLSHTESHLLYLGVMDVRPDAIAATLGCHIRPYAADLILVLPIDSKPKKWLKSNGLPMRWCHVEAQCACMRMNSIPTPATGNAKEK